MAVTVVDQWIFLMILLLLLRLRHEPLGFGLRPTDKNCLSPLMIERDSLRMAQCSIEATLAMNFLEVFQRFRRCIFQAHHFGVQKIPRACVFYP